MLLIWISNHFIVEEQQQPSLNPKLIVEEYNFKIFRWFFFQFIVIIGVAVSDIQLIRYEKQNTLLLEIEIYLIL